MARYKLIDCMPISHFKSGYDDIVVNLRGEYSVGFRLRMKEVFTLQQEDYKSMDRTLENLVKRMPVNTVVHFQCRYSVVEFKPSDFKKFEKEKYGIYKGFKFLERAMVSDEIYIFITKSTAAMKTRAKGHSLLHKRFVPGELLDVNIEKEFYNATISVEDMLRTSDYFKVERLRKKDFNDLENENGIIPDYFSLKTTSKGKSGYHDIDFKNGINVGSRVANIIAVDGLDSFAEEVGTERNYGRLGANLSFTFGLGIPLKFDHVVNHYFFIEDTKLLSANMQMKRNKLSNFSTVSDENKANYEGVKEFVEGITKDERYPVRYYVNVLNIADDADRLADQSLQVETAFSELGFRSRINLVDRAEIFWSGCPGNPSDIPFHYRSTIFLDQAVNMLPKESSYRDSLSEFGVKFTDRISGYPINVDFIQEPKDLGIVPNYNMFTIGPSGSGKSFVTNLILRTLYYQGNHMVLVDMGRSYMKFCDSIGGKFIDPGEKDFEGYNPFLLVGKAELTDDRIELIANLLFALWYNDGRPVTSENLEYMKYSIIDYFNRVEDNNQFKDNKKIFPCFNSFYSYMSQKYKNIMEKVSAGIKDEDTAVVEKNYFDFESFKLVMKPFAKGGRYANMLNARKVLDLAQDRFVLFEMENIKDNETMMNLQVLMIMDIFLTKLLRLGEDHPALKTLLIEEAWKSMMNPRMANFLKYSVKTFRKYKGQLNVVSQEIEDIIGNEIVKNAVINSSPIKVLLDPMNYKEQIDLVGDMLSLTPNQKRLYASLNRNNDPNEKYKEVLIITGPLAMVYRCEVSDYEYAMFTTDADEVPAIRNMQKKYKGDIDMALIEFAEDRQIKKLNKN